jgi:hypothetical protein
VLSCVSNWLTPLVSGAIGIVGVCVGGVFPFLLARWQRNKRQFGHWSAMSAEVDLCKGLAETYVNGNKMAPLYRLPTVSYDVGYPALLADGAVDNDEAMAILRFYLQVTQIKRGLEYAHAARGVTVPKDALIDEASRLQVKAQALFDPACKDPGGPYYARVRTVIDKHIKH